MGDRSGAGRRSGFEARGSPRSWLYTIATNATGAVVDLTSGTGVREQ